MFATSPRQRQRVWQMMGEEWEKMNRKALSQAIDALYQSKLIDFKDRGDGVVQIVLADGGRKKAIQYNIDKLKLEKPKRWDGKWRIVCFDIPKDRKKVREALRFHLKRLGFHQLQKSVFVHPYPCWDEVDFLIEIYKVRPYVREVTASHIDNELHLKRIFGLL